MRERHNNLILFILFYSSKMFAPKWFGTSVEFKKYLHSI